MNALHLEVLAQCMFEYGKIPSEGDMQRPDIPEDDWLNVIERMEQEILNYTNLHKVPKTFKYTWASMCVDYMRYWLAASNNDAGDQTENPEDVSMTETSIKVGDTDIKYSNTPLSSGDTASRAKQLALVSHKPDLDDVVFNYRQQLNKIRRLVWR